MHEIWQISGPEIWWISCMKFGGFHEIWQISWQGLICDMRDTILFFGYNVPKDALSRVV